VERWLNQAVQGLLAPQSADGSSKGWLRRKLEGRLLRMVQKYTLARFRDEDAQYGGVNLAKVQAELETLVDEVLVAKLKHGVNFWTAIVLVLLPLQVVAAVYLLVLMGWAR